jgi:hypothetical protein
LVILSIILAATSKKVTAQLQLLCLMQLARNSPDVCDNRFSGQIRLKSHLQTWYGLF